MGEEMTHNPLALLEQFNSAFHVKSFIQEDAYGRRALLKLRARLIKEESGEAVDELLDAMNGEGSLERLLKELADTLYVVYGTALAFDLPIYEALLEVHSSNMSKLGLDGQPVLDRGGKVLKGPNYRPADMKKVLATRVSA